MKFFTNCATLDELKKEYRRKFYTQNGWEGDRYDPNLSLKEIAQLVRQFIKEQFPTYKFSVRTSYASMCQELHVEMKEAPCKIYKDFSELTADEKTDLIHRMMRNNIFDLASWTDTKLEAEFLRIWEDYGDWYKCPSDQITATAAAVDGFVQSFNYDDSDGMIDYFDNNFYYFGCLQNNARGVKFVPKTARITTTKASTEASTSPVRVEINPEFDGVEVYFSGKPAEEVRTALKAAGYRWHSKKKCWYARNTERNLQALRTIETNLIA